MADGKKMTPSDVAKVYLDEGFSPEEALEVHDYVDQEQEENLATLDIDGLMSSFAEARAEALRLPEAAARQEALQDNQLPQVVYPA